MTIRIQNLLVIPPIFLMLGLAVGFLANRAAKEEILWGLNEEAVALAVTVAEMTGDQTLEGLVAGDTVLARAMKRDLNGLARWGQVESVMVFSSAKDGAVLSFHRDSTAASMEQDLWDTSLRDLSAQSVLGAVGTWGPYPAALAAAAPIRIPDVEAPPVGAVAVVIDATRMASVTQELRRDLAFLVLGVTLLGVSAALFLSVILGRQIWELRRVGAAVASGEYRVQVQVRGVKEVQDLSNTLGTMASILSDVLSRGRRALLVGDPFQLAQGMAAAYRESRLDGAQFPADVDVGISPIGKVPPGCFHGWAETPAHVVFWAGETTASGPLDAAVEAAAVTQALTRGIHNGEPEEVAAAVSDLFQFSTFQLAWFDRPVSGPPTLRTKAGSGAPVVKGAYTVLHSFQSEHMDSLVGSLSLVKDLPAGQAASEIPLALPETLSGILILIRPSSPSA